MLAIALGLVSGLSVGALVRASRIEGAGAGHTGHAVADASAMSAMSEMNAASSPPAPHGAGHGDEHGASPNVGHSDEHEVAPNASRAPHAEHGLAPEDAFTTPVLDTTRALVVDLENAVCPVMGGAARESVFTDWRGVRVRFCCAGCDADFLAEPEALLRAIDIDPTLHLEVAAKLADATPEARAAVCEEYGHRVRIVPAEAP